MNETLEKHLKETFNLRDSMYFLSLLQKIKTFADTQLAESAGKSEQERTQVLFNTLLNIRDTAASELVEYTLARRVEASILEHNTQVEKELQVEHQETEDLAAYGEFQDAAQKKS